LTKPQKQIEKYENQRKQHLNRTKIHNKNDLIKFPIINDNKNCLTPSSSTSCTSSKKICSDPVHKLIDSHKSKAKAKELDQSLRPALKHTITEEKNKNQKRVSFSQLIKSNKRIKLKHKPNIYYSSNRIEDDSDNEQLVIDFSDRELVPSISDSDDSYDGALDHSSNKSQKPLEKSDQNPSVRTSSHSSVSSEEEKGDPNRVIEIIIDSDEDDKCERIFPQQLKIEAMSTTSVSLETDSSEEKQQQKSSSDSHSVEVIGFVNLLKEPIDKSIAGSSQKSSYNKVNDVSVSLLSND